MEQERVLVQARPLAAVVLAAGESRRMGSPKLLLPLEGDTILGRTLTNAMAGGLSPLTVICGAYAKDIAAQAQAKGLPYLFNVSYALGQSTSLIMGLKAAPEGYGIMYILGDQPFVSPDSYAALAAAYRDSEALIVAPQGTGGRRGNPVIFAPSLFAEIATLRGDMGARAIVEKYRQQTLLVPLKDKGLHIDVDTPRAYRRYCQEKRK